MTVEYLLFDLGYLLFYRLHATTSWTRHQEKEFSEDEIISYFRSHLESQLTKMQKKFRSARMVFCKDELQAAVWRREIFPEYKATRGVADDFIRRLKQVLYEVVVKYGAMFAAPKLEADDVAYLIVRYLQEHMPVSKIMVITSDRDYLQIASENVEICDANFKPLRSSGDPEKDLWIKVLMGDTSDNIPPIMKGCGKKTAELLATDPQKRQEYIEKHACQVNLDRNELLIRFDRIPEEYCSRFYSEEQETLQKLCSTM